MKLNDINEGLISQKMREAIRYPGILNNDYSLNNIYNPMAGQDFGSRNLSNTSNSVGIPYKQKHRKLMGMGPLNARPGSIRLVY